MKNFKNTDVDDWPRKINVGDWVMYQSRKWKVVKKYSNRWHTNKPTFLLSRECITGDTEIIEV